MNKNKKLVKVEESRMKIGFGMSRKFRRFVRIRRSVMRFGFEMSKSRDTIRNFKKVKMR